MNTEVTKYIDSAPEIQKAIMNSVRSLIHQSLEGISEEFKWSRPVFKKDKSFSYLLATKNHVNLGFMDFHKISDPKGLLEGTGKDMRHIKLKTMDDIDPHLLKKWFIEITQ